MENKIKLLIVDDEVQFLDSIAERLELRDFDVTKASRGAEALQIADKQKFDLALLDLKMPGMDGRELLEILKREHKYLEVIMLTGHGSLESAVECTKLGAFGYLPKPYELDKLIETLVGAYAARLRNKLGDSTQLQQAVGLEHPMARLRALRDLDRA